MLKANDELIVDIPVAVRNVQKNHSDTEDLIQKEVVERIRRIRFNIERGRDVIRHYSSSAGEYNASTSVELKPPEIAYGPSIQTQVSFAVGTNQENALLLFMGNTQEFLAFESDTGGNLQVFVRGPGYSRKIETGLNIRKGTADWKTVTFVR